MGISREEVLWITQGVLQNMRNDGRMRDEFRPFEMQTNILPHSMGSCKFSCGQTQIVVSIKAEIGTPLTSRQNAGYITFSVERSQSITENSLSDDRLGIMASALEKIFNASDALDLEKLCLVEKRLCWVISIDAVVLNFDGNILDSISFATRAALASTKIPNVVVDTENVDFEIDEAQTTFSLDISNFPICVTLFQIGNNFIFDADLQEEGCSSTSVTIFVNPRNKICGIENFGAGGILPSAMVGVFQSALKNVQILWSRLNSLQ